jgi:hypothetical protein
MKELGSQEKMKNHSPNNGSLTYGKLRELIKALGPTPKTPIAYICHPETALLLRESVALNALPSRFGIKLNVAVCNFAPPGKVAGIEDSPGLILALVICPFCKEYHWQDKNKEIEEKEKQQER